MPRCTATRDRIRPLRDGDDGALERSSADANGHVCNALAGAFIFVPEQGGVGKTSLVRAGGLAVHSQRGIE
jgi:hypothetical protein